MSASVSTEGPASSQEHPESGSASDARSQPAPDPEAEAKGTSVESCSGSRLKGEGGECAEDKPGERSGGHSALPGVRRVKVYQLDKESWTDLGTGYCHVHESKPAGQLRHQEQDLWESVDEGPDSGPWVAVTPEHTEQIGEFIWRTTIRAIMLLALTSGEEDPDEVLADASSAFGFHRQQDTLIVWTEPDGIDMALSFANVEACAQVWDLILHTKSLIYESNLSISLNDSSSSSDGGPPSSPQLFNSFSHTGHHQPSHFFSQPGTLPPPSFDNIHLVQQSLKWQVRTPSGREKLAAWFVKSNYAHALIALKTDAEDLESVDTLHMLCNILQTVLLINDNLIFDHIIQDDIFLGVAGILEYDPEFPKMKANYVAHLSDPARFVQVVPITHAPTLSKIHQTYRLSYLKDVMLARIIDDPTYTMLNSFIFFHQIDIVQHLQQDHRFLSALFALFEQPSDPYASDLFTKQREAILLLHQFCTLAKNLQLAPRQSFYRSMSDKGLLRALEVMLQRTAHLNGQDQSQQPATEVENAVRVTTIEILMMLIEHHPNSVRSYCLRSIPSSDDPSSPDSKETEQAGRSLVSFLIALLNTEEDLGIQAQMTEAIKVLAHAPNQSASDNTGGVLGTVDSGKGRQEDPEAERFLQYLYDHCISALFQPLLDLTDPNQQPNHAIELSCGRSGLCAQLCDLLVHFIGTHTFRSKYFVLSTPVCSRVARLFRSSQKHLSLAAIRFYKATLVRKDDFYNRYLAKHDLIKPILDVAVGEVGKDNLVASACLDFFEHIRINNTKPLLNHIMEEYSEVIKSLAESETVFQLLVMKWEQNNEPPPEDTAEGRNVINRGGPYGGRQTGTLEAEEESYFNDSSSGEDDEEGLAHDGVEPRPELSPAVQMPTSKKRKIEDTRSKKRQRTDSAPTLLYAAHPSPSVKGSIVRSPALVFQEMAVKGSQRRARSNTSASAPAKPLVSYGEGDDEPKSPDTLERPGTPTLSKRLPEYPSTPPNVVRPRKSEPPDIHSTLGSPFQSIDDNIGEREDTEPRFSREGPPPSLKSLGEKRRREEEEDDVLANVERKRSKTHLGAKSSAAPSATNGSVAATTTKSKGGGFASGLTKLKLNFGLGGGSSKKSG